MTRSAADGRLVLAELACTVVIPSVVLVFLSSPDRLGPVVALCVALAPPIGWAVFTQIRERRVSGLAMIALVSVAVSGGIGLAGGDARWFAWKEALVPGALGVLAIATAPTRFAPVPALLDRILDPERTRTALAARGALPRFAFIARRATVEIGVVLLASAVGSFFLASAMVQAPAGTEGFAEELGRYTAISFPVVTVPVLVVSVFVLRRALVGLEDAAGVALEELLR